MEWDFANNTLVEALEKVPSDFRSFYVEKDGKFALNSENAAIKSAVAVISGQNQALKASRAELKARKEATPQDLSLLSEYGTDPATILAKIKEREETLQGQIKGFNPEKVKEDLAKQYKGDVDKHATRAQKREEQLFRVLGLQAAQQALKELKGNESLLMPVIEKQIKAIEDKDGKVQVVVLDKSGDVRWSGVSGSPMSVPELVQELRSDAQYAVCFASDTPSGGGASPTNVARPTVIGSRPGTEPTGMTAMEKIRMGIAKKQYSKS